MSNPFDVLARARRLATGVGLDFEPANLRPVCATEAEFDAVVRDYYTFFYEHLATDATFLVRLRPAKDVDFVRRLLYDLRTAANHSDNPKSEEAAARWRRGHSSPQAAANALAGLLGAALEALSRAAVLAARDQAASTEWREIASVEVGAVFVAVSEDLGLSFTEGNRRRMVRLIEKRIQVHPHRGDRQALVAEYCAQEMLAARRPLPVPYDRVLDALGLLRSRQASGAILIAHSVAEVAPTLRGEAFLERVAETWRAAGALVSQQT
ncbi:hypothetical protein [Cellulomonas sp. SG140]|uniref:hypothetical protein n=1 Tax=Cellulomonas sp. SG140 TaxID=2976536 RepID=UPI0021E80A68|nr:hypothetical protein [Cellulomonas sp. SG140]